MKKASLLIQNGDVPQGLKIYSDLEKNAVDQSFRDIATILYVLNSMDIDDPVTLLMKLENLESSKIWKSSALEMKGFLFLKMDQKDKAKEIFSSILELPSSPSSLATRAKNMLEFLKE